MSIIRTAALFALLTILSTWSCTESAPTTTADTMTTVVGNPAAKGFNKKDSDEKAIVLADKVMTANGGRTAWDNTRHLRWNFFGRRDLWWDKQTGDVRIESAADGMTYLFNINENSGQVSRRGVAITAADSLQEYTARGKSIWINDSYWLVFPFKLKDSGVTLRYMGQDTTAKGATSEVVQLTFDSVGDTPDNRYLAYISPEGMVTQWDFYSNAADT
ncbi:MAG: hypothetical protein AAGK47_08350, partial [Bacteroidota bacterium]